MLDGSGYRAISTGPASFRIERVAVISRPPPVRNPRPIRIRRRKSW